MGNECVCKGNVGEWIVVQRVCRHRACGEESGVWDVWVKIVSVRVVWTRNV